MSDPRCSALAAAMSNKKMSYGDIAKKVGRDEKHVTEVCTGAVKPTQAEYDELARALDMKAPVPHDSAHPNA